MSQSLLVPIHLDALVVESELTVATAMADFSRLPYFDGEQDRNANHAYLSEEFLSQPFEDKSLILKAGIHLHWALPDALTKTMTVPLVRQEAFTSIFGQKTGRAYWKILVQSGHIAIQSDRSLTTAYVNRVKQGVLHNTLGLGDDQPIIEQILRQSSFAPVPTRWLITRTGNGDTHQWVIESDYLHRDRAMYTLDAKGHDATTFPVPPVQPSDPPFRYMGRAVPVDQWKEQSTTTPESFLSDPLTAVGYGEATFASYYPNCHSVFGFHDPVATTGSAQSLQYDVIGWYGNMDDDYLRTFIKDVKSSHADTSSSAEPSIPKITSAVLDEFAWQMHDQRNEQGTLLPDRTVCYSSITVDPQAVGSPTSTAEVSVAVGPTDAEALAAQIAGSIDSGTSELSVENELEAVQLASQLNSRTVDLDAYFDEARHSNGFNAVPAGSLWTVRLLSAKNEPANAEQGQAKAQVNLDPELAHLLNRANVQQQRYDQALHQTDSLRQQLYADWCKYMLSAYPPQDSHDQYPRIDRIKYFMENRSLPELQAQLDRTGLLFIGKDSAGAYERADSKQPNSIASELGVALSMLFKAVKKHNSAELLENNVAYVVEQTLAPRYWQPSDPAILLTGPDAYYPEKHGFDKTLLCTVIPQALSTCPSTAELNAITQAVNEQLTKLPEGSIGKSIFRQQPWNPFLLEWEANVFPTSDVHSLQPEDDFSISYLNDNFVLPATGSELLPRNNAPQLGARPYSGRIVLTPHAGKQLNHHLKEMLVQLLRPHLLKQFYTDQKIAKAQQNDGFIVRHTVTEFMQWGKNLTLWETLPRLDERLSASAQIDSWLSNAMQAVAAWYLTHVAQNPKTALGKPIPSPIASNFKDVAKVYEARMRDEQSALKAEMAKPNLVAANIEKLHTTLHELHSELSTITLALTYATLRKTPTLSQTLNGFNTALLSRKQTLQFGVADPLGFDTYQAFAQRVQAGVLNANHSAPQPLDAFSPIRTGLLDLPRMRLIDTFGQIRTVPTDNPTVAARFRSNNPLIPIQLPPRLAQPARLDFRWQSANHSDVESNAHVATSPICGWLLANNLDNTIMIYDHRGAALGSLNGSDPTVPWRPAPGSDDPLFVDQIENRHLRQLVTTLVALQLRSVQAEPQAIHAQQTYLDSFISMLDGTLEHIEPANFAEHQGRAVLMSKPVALVRATVGFSLLGLPAVDQSWAAFYADMEASSATAIVARDTDAVPNQGQFSPRQTRQFEKVRLPIRIGDVTQLNDGLVGYWLEENDGHYMDGLFYATQSNQNFHQNDYLLTRRNPQDKDDSRFDLQLALADEAITLSMLVDPRGSVHATTGLLPTKEIVIPPEHYAKVLEAIEITFLSTPLLTEAGRVSVSLPNEPGYSWSWLDRQEDAWREIGTVGYLRKATVQQTFVDDRMSGDMVWETLVNAGWIVPTNLTRAEVLPIDQRTKPDLGKQWQSVLPKIEQMLDRTHITSFNASATFTSSQEIREGWLKLHKVDDT